MLLIDDFLAWWQVVGLVWNTGMTISFLQQPWWRLSSCCDKAESGADKADWSLEAMCRKGKPENLSGHSS